MKKLLPAFVLLAVLFTPALSQAVVYLVYFDDFSNDAVTPTSFQNADWTDTYTSHFDFNPLIGNCPDPAQCTYDQRGEGILPHQSTHHGAHVHSDMYTIQTYVDPFWIFGQLRYEPATGRWVTLNGLDSIDFRQGLFIVNISEPSPMLLLLVGLAAMAFRKQWIGVA